MSKRQHYGTDIDRAFLSKDGRQTAYRVYVWNPNRTTINDVVLGDAASPRYDITKYVLSVAYWENIVFEDNDQAVATHCTLDVAYDPDARPIEITERTLVDGTPIRILMGDRRVPVPDWPVLFTGVVRGCPSVQEHWRGGGNRSRQMQLTVMGRAEAFLNTTVTARSYARGTDVGKAAVETAIEWMELDRREVAIGHQGYSIGHPQSQLVDIEVLKGLHQMLFVVGKKPRFDAEGFLVAADTDLDKAPARTYDNRSLVVSITREQRMTSGHNSVRLLGSDNNLTEVVEREKRLAHGSITAGFFESNVKQEVWFSETPGKQSGGRRAKDTWMKSHIGSVGEFFGENAAWTPYLEDDGYTCFGGEISFDTGFDPYVRMAVTVTWAVTNTAEGYVRTAATEAAAVNDFFDAANLSATADVLHVAAGVAMVGVLLTLTEIGRVEWEIFGRPFQHVYQQLCATAQLDGVLTADLKELEVRNDWLYDIEYMRTRARALLDRELAKAWSYQIEMLDDPLIEVDDVIEIADRRWYITSIRRTLRRTGAPVGTMILTAWRLT